MKAINVLELKKGMVLAEDVRATNGRLLIATGTILDRKHLRIMNIWGVTEAWIHEHDESVQKPEAGSVADSETFGKLQQYVDQLFIGHDLDQEETAELHRLKIMDLMERVKDGWKPHPEPFSNDEPSEVVGGAEPESISALLAKDVDLASIPDIYFQLRKVIDDISASGEHIAEVISRDPGISARLLKMVNSPIYGYGGKIESLKDGVFIIGTRGLSELVLCMSLIDQFKKFPVSIIKPRQIWTHSIACGVIARVLASYRNDLNPDRCFVAGLLHDVGKLIMITRMPQKVKEISRVARKNRIPVFQAEQKLLQWDHARLVSELFRTWNFPPELRDIVGNHHDLETARDYLETSVVHIADIITIIWEYGSSISSMVPPISRKAWKALDLPKSVLATTISKSKRQIEDMVSIFLE